MSFVGSNILAGASGQGGGGYEIERSLRFNSGDSSSLTRTPSSAGNRTTWTWSGWVKRTEFGTEHTLFGAGTSSSNADSLIMFNAADQIDIWNYPGSFGTRKTTSAVFRDPSAFYHVVFSCNGSSYLKIYVNGVEQALSTDTGPDGSNWYFNGTSEHSIGKHFTGRRLNGYLADVHFIDGQALAPTDFGETDDNGVWQPKKFGGVYAAAYSGTTTSLSQTGWNPAHSGNIWDGNASSASRATGYVGGTNGTVTFDPPLTNVIKVEAWTQNYNHYLNGSQISTPESVNGGWHTYYDNSTGITLSTLGNSYGSGGQTVDLAGIRINGSIVDSQTWTPPSGVGFASSGVNSFHLPFTDNSSNAALGTDTSGNNNTWTVNNLTASVPAVDVGGDPTVSSSDKPFTSGYSVAFDGNDKLRMEGPGTVSGDFTWECWIKFTGTPSGRFFSAEESVNGTEYSLMRFWNGNFSVYCGDGGGYEANTYTGSVSADTWHHIAMVRSGSTVSHYLDGSRWGTNSFSNSFSITTLVLAHGYGSEYFTGSVSNARFVNGQALYTGASYTVPTATLTTTSQSATASNVTTLVAHKASLTANDGTKDAIGDSAVIDSLVDSPTNGTQTDTGAGGEVVANYCTWNPVQPTFATTSFSNGNLDCSLLFTNGSTTPYAVGNFVVFSGKWYWEITLTQESNDTEYIGIISGSKASGAWAFADIGAYFSDARKAIGASPSSYGTSYTTGDVIGIALDADNGNLTFYKNGVSQGAAATGMTVFNGYKPFTSSNGTSTAQLTTANFGQRAFAYTAPSGYKSLNTANLPDPTIADGSKYFDTKLYTGNDTQRNISGLSFSPDLVWIKTRNTTSNHSLMDTVRGATKNLVPNDTQAEGTEPSYLNAFNSDGFSLGTSSVVNGNNNTYAAWTWDAGTSGANEVGSYWSPAYNTKYIGFKFPTSGGGRAVFGLESGTGTADIYTSTDNSSWTRVQQNVTLSTTDSSYNSSAQYLIVVNTSDATWGAHHYAMATNGTDGHYSSAAYPGSGASFTWSGPGYTDWDFRSSGTVIKPGGLNSLLYNQSQTWSNLVTGTLDTQYGNPSTAAPFQGTTGTNYTDGIRPTGGNYLSMNFGSTFASATTVTIYGHVSLDGVTYNGANENLKINGTALTAAGWANNGGGTGSGQASATFTLSSGLTSLEWGYSAGSQSTGYLYLQAIAVDGKLLVDSTVTPPSVPSMASTIRANPSAGFSICTYTGTEGGTFGHGLNAAPKFVMVKRRSNPAAAWCVWHTAIPNTQYLMLNDTAGVNTANVWGNTSPTSSVVSVSGDSYTGNNGDTYVAYCFAPVEGYSSFGKFTANASADGPFVYLGFRPALVVCKKSSSSSIWITLDSERDPNNVTTKFLRWNDITAEASTADRIDFLSNGFKLRAPGGYSPNETNGDTYIYLAFAEHPFKTARAR